MQRPDTPLMLERRGGALLVTLNRPQARNALNGVMLDAIETVLAEAREDPALGILVLRGAGGYFCAGGDLKERATLSLDSEGPNSLQERNTREGRLIASINSLPQIVVSAVEGGAVGGGLGIVSVSDLVIAATPSIFWAPEVRSGAVPAQIAPYIVRRLGGSHARRLLLTGSKCDVVEAHRIGLVHQVIPAGESFDSFLALALKQLEGCDPSAVAAAKKLLATLEPENSGYIEAAAATYAAISRQRR